MLEGVTQRTAMPNDVMEMARMPQCVELCFGAASPRPSPPEGLSDSHIFARLLSARSPSTACGRGRGPRPLGRGRGRDGASIRHSLTFPIPSGWAPSLSRKRTRDFYLLSPTRETGLARLAPGQRDV